MRFPRLAQYLGQLPDSLASYPECLSKAMLARSSIEGHDLSELDEGLPPAVRDAIWNPPPAGVWMSAVLTDAVFHAVCDRFYPSQKAIEEWSLRRTRTTSTNRVYRRLIGVAGPAVFLRIAEEFHNRLVQKGTVVRIEVDKRESLIHVTHPPYLHNTTKHATNVPMLTSLLEIVGGKDVIVEMRISDPDRAQYRATWR
ncbi:MAG: hypothetical protein AAGF12_01115 [Myxococcota bacterium]